MTKEERYAIWNRYYQRHKTEINARRKIVRENYKNKLSKAENKIAELEKENATLKKQLEALSGDIPWNKLKDVSEVTKELTEAKDLLKKVVGSFYYLCEINNFSTNYECLAKAEQFLKEE